MKARSQPARIRSNPKPAIRRPALRHQDRGRRHHRAGH